VQIGCYDELLHLVRSILGMLSESQDNRLKYRSVVILDVIDSLCVLLFSVVDTDRNVLAGSDPGSSEFEMNLN
jgi:hypothetical protein